MCVILFNFKKGKIQSPIGDCGGGGDWWKIVAHNASKRNHNYAFSIAPVLFICQNKEKQNKRTVSALLDSIF